MKTLVCTSPGHFEYSDSPLPEMLEDHAVIKVKRIGICGTDLHAFAGTQPYFRYPRILGHELAAELIDIDDNSDFKQGDSVTIIPYFYCGACIACRTGKPNCCVNLRVFGVHVDGGMSEYVSVPSYSLVRSNGLSIEALALLEPLSIGAHAVTRANVKPNEFVLVIGAGPIGLGTMEFARVAGGRIIALDINESRLNFCKQKLNIEYTINGATENVLERLKEITSGDMPTVIMDATGSLKAINNAFSFMAHTARYVLVGLQKESISFVHPEFHKREATLMSSRNATREDFEHVIACISKGWVHPEAYITRRVKFDEVKSNFPSWLIPANGVIKIIVEL